MTACWDQTNAFPSVRHTFLDEATLRNAELEDAVLLWSRYHDAASMIADGERAAICLRAGCGDRQGDSPAAERYVLSMDKHLERWCAETANLAQGCWLGVRVPWGGNWVWPLHAQYGDDTARVGTAGSTRGLVATAVNWNESLKECTAPMGVAQNVGQLQLMFGLQPATMKEHQRLHDALAEVALVKQKVVAAKHLGCWHELQPGHHWEISQCIAKANSAWNAWHGLWFCDTVDIKWKKRVLQSVVAGRLLAGLETICPGKRNSKRLEATMSRKLRCLLRGRKRTSG